MSLFNKNRLLLFDSEPLTFTHPLLSVSMNHFIATEKHKNASVDWASQLSQDLSSCVYRFIFASRFVFIVQDLTKIMRKWLNAHTIHDVRQFLYYFELHSQIFFKRMRTAQCSWSDNHRTRLLKGQWVECNSRVVTIESHDSCKFTLFFGKIIARTNLVFILVDHKVEAA